MTWLAKRFSPRQLRIGIAVGLIAFLSVGGTATASAFWSANAGAVSATATSTNAAVDMDDVKVLDNAFKFTGASGPLTIKPITIRNTGGAPLSYTLTATAAGSTALAANIKVWDWLQTGGTCGTTVPSGASVGTLAALPSALPAGASSGAGNTSLVLCVATQLNTTDAASQGLSTTVTFLLTGTVGTNWSATDSSVTTQSVFQFAGALGAITCTNRSLADGLGILLTWPVTTGATGGYNVYVGTNTTPTVTVAQPATGTTTASVRLNYQENDQSYVIGGATQIRVVPFESTYGTSGVGRSQTIHVVPVAAGISTLNCN